ncbi:ATP-binding protein [Cylindrospermopsis curvispora]|uniref:ATP-binding protein n=1 Tax=Cylindrospermopsis curvispora GIHE-G1 TaxID=2666332 RepID=A0A7H0F1Y0_9CYAN|nr:ATP-binding protein [Cylindrospermopsis curvispora]QNP30046.1 ATP-binding protein [Cylindrospermopsis curvispora GIHE-G1]
MNPKNLPLGINTLDKLRGSNCVYVDKTRLALQLIKQPGAFFLSRPRRFGKSLFLDTLKEIFEGNQKLFEGLYIHDQWDWGRKFPVIKIDLAGGVLKNRQELDLRILDILHENAEHLGVSYESTDIPGKLGTLIRKAMAKYGQRAVVLVDEYDKPILDNIDNPPIALEMREGLKNLYSVLKQQDANIQFIFMTGVTKFSKVSLFSGLNQLTDITISRDFSTICGYTQEDLEQTFAQHLQGVDWDELRLWYNGYSWRGESVYNPYDILLFIREGMEYGNYWFETGNPSFLIKLFQTNRYFLPNLEHLEVTEEILKSFEIEQINPVTLLFQSGYLTIERTFTRHRRSMFALKIPNMEVRLTLNDQFINVYTGMVNEKSAIQDILYECMWNGDLKSIVKAIKRLFAGIPWRNFTNNHLADFEGYYASVLYAFLSSLNARIIPEDITNYGQADITAMLGNHIYVMEIKVVDGENVKENLALKQIRECNYAQKYRGEPGKTVHEVGLVFSRSKRNLIQADWE